MKKWEYRHETEETVEDLIDKCNELGVEGWEVISVRESEAIFTCSAFLKREVKNE